MSKSAGTTVLSVTNLTHKPKIMLFVYTAQFYYYYWNENNPNVMEYYNQNGVHDSAYDVTGTFTVTDTSFATPAFLLSNAGMNVKAISIYEE